MENPIPGFFIWNWNSELFSSNGVTLRWSVVLFITAFLAGRQLLIYLSKKDHQSLAGIANLPIYLVIAALIGARLGHLVFYEPESALSKAVTIVFPFAFKPDFHFLGRNEFSVHGAVLASLLFLFFYTCKKSRESSFLILDRVALASSLGGVFIFLGSFLNSEPVGAQTTSATGTIFIAPVLKGLMKVPCCIMRTPDGDNPLTGISVEKDPASSGARTTHKPIILRLFFKPGSSEQLINEFLIGDVKKFLYDMSEFVYEPGTQPLRYQIFAESKETYFARISTVGIARHPVQIFEAIICLALVVIMRPYGKKSAPDIHPGRIFGWIMMTFWTFEVAIGFLKEGQLLMSILLNVLFAVAGLSVFAIVSRTRRGHPEKEAQKVANT